MFSIRRGLLNVSGCSHSFSQRGSASIRTAVSSKTSNAMAAIRRASGTRRPDGRRSTMATSASLSRRWVPRARLPNRTTLDTEHSAGSLPAKSRIAERTCRRDSSMRVTVSPPRSAALILPPPRLDHLSSHVGGVTQWRSSSWTIVRAAGTTGSAVAHGVVRAGAVTRIGRLAFTNQILFDLLVARLFGCSERCDE